MYFDRVIADLFFPVSVYIVEVLAFLPLLENYFTYQKVTWDYCFVAFHFKRPLGFSVAGEVQFSGGGMWSMSSGTSRRGNRYLRTCVQLDEGSAHSHAIRFLVPSCYNSAFLCDICIVGTHSVAYLLWSSLDVVYTYLLWLRIHTYY